MSEYQKINEMDAADVVAAAQEKDKQRGTWAPDVKAAAYRKLIRREARNNLSLGLLNLAQVLACVVAVVTGDMAPVVAVAAAGLVSTGIWFYRAKVGFEA